MSKVIVQRWEESENGWALRPDGYSLHITDEDRQNFIQDYWDSMPEEVPDEYSRPSVEPYKARVDKGTFAEIRKSKNGTRHFDRPPLPLKKVLRKIKKTKR